MTLFALVAIVAAALGALGGFLVGCREGRLEAEEAHRRVQRAVRLAETTGHSSGRRHGIHAVRD